MRAGVLIPALLAAALAARPAAGAEPPAAGAESPAVREELALAARAFRDGLYELVAARMEKLLARGEFPERDRVELLLAGSDYLRGRREEAEQRFRKLLPRLENRELRDECSLWIGRLESEFRGRHDQAERRLRRLYEKLNAAGEVAPELLAICRYWLARALVEQGGLRQLDGYEEEFVDEAGRRKAKHVAGAIGLLDEHIRLAKALQAEAHVLRGRALYLRGRPDQCFERLRDEFLGSTAFGKSPLRGEAFFWQAEARYGQSKWLEAAELFSAAAGAAGRFGNRPAKDKALAAEALYNRGWALHKRAADLRRAGLAGEKELLRRALESFRRAAAGGGQKLARAARLRGGEALYLLGRHQEALRGLGPLRADARHGAEALYLSARAQAGLGRHGEARRLLEQAAGSRTVRAGGGLAARIDSARGENFFRLAQAAAKAGDEPKRKDLLERAAEAFSRVLAGSTAAAGRYAARLWVARVRAEQGRLEEAVSITEELAGTVPAREALRADRIAYYRGSFLLEGARRGLHRIHLKFKKSDGTRISRTIEALPEAVRSFNQARRAGPRGEFAVPAMLGAAEAHLRLQNTPDASRIYFEVQISPLAAARQVHEAKLGTARTLKENGRFKKAADFVEEKLLTAEPPPAAGIVNAALELRAECLARAESSEEAARAFGLLAGRAGDPGKAARARVNRAAQVRGLGRHAEAAADLAGLLKSCPEAMRAEVEFLAAEAYRAAGEAAEALRHYTASAGRPGGYQARARVGAAELALASGRARRAAAQARAALDLVQAGSMLAARAALVRAGALLATGQAGDAVRQYRQAAEAARGHRAGEEGRRLELEARRGLARALAALGRHEDAAASYLKAAYLTAEKLDPEILKLAAEALERAGEAKAAGEVRALMKSKENG